MKAFRLVLFLILLGTKMHTVKSMEEEISIRQEMDRKLNKVLVHRADSSSRCRRMKFCESEWKEGGDWQEREKEGTARERTQGLWKKIARRRTRAPYKVEANRWKGGEFKKSGRKRSGQRGRKGK